MAQVLDRTLPLTLTYQLYQILREQLAGGVLTPGAPFPTERTIAEQYQVSRITVREAMNRLVFEGYLMREHGRGTFVARPKVSEQMSTVMIGYTEEMLRRGMQPSSKVLELTLETPPAPVRQALHLGQDGQAMKLARLRLADRKPMTLQTSYLPCPICQGLFDGDIDWSRASMTRELSRQGREIHHAVQRISVSLAGEDEARELGLDAGAPLLVGERTSYLADDRPIEYLVSLYRGDRYYLTLYLGPRGN